MAHFTIQDLSFSYPQNSRKVLNNVNLSIQSGADNVLALMNRKYDRQEYLDIVKVLKEHDPLYGITTDIISGFPGETDADFADSLDIIDRVGFCKVHAFKYSVRKGTPAEKMKQVPGDIKNARAQKLNEKAEEDALRFYDLCQGAVRSVLFEEKAGDGMITGYTDNYIKTYVPGDESMLNQFYDVKLIDRFKDGMKGELANG